MAEDCVADAGRPITQTKDRTERISKKVTIHPLSRNYPNFRQK